MIGGLWCPGGQTNPLFISFFNFTLHYGTLRITNIVCGRRRRMMIHSWALKRLFKKNYGPQLGLMYIAPFHYNSVESSNGNVELLHSYQTIGFFLSTPIYKLVKGTSD